MVNNHLHINVEQEPQVKKEKDYISSVQSANVLFKFMNKLDYLQDILLKKAILPRYYEERIDYLNIHNINKIAFPMSCFCDIHLNKLVPHMINYGSYGIGLSKEWGIQKGIQPIKYINPKSGLCADFAELFGEALSSNKNEREILNKYNNYLLHDLFYMKPLIGEMISGDGDVKKRNFHDEKEWRFIPNVNNVKTDLPLVLSQQLMNPNSYSIHSEGIKHCSDLWLKFEFEQIKHIIVSYKNERLKLINFIIENNIGDKYEQYILFSKIIVFDELKEDW